MLFCSCEPQRNLVYFSEESSASKNSNIELGKAEIKIQSNDLLRISVSSLSIESNDLFNSPSTQSGYRIDNNGNVNFPVAGNIKLEGLDLEQAQIKITNELVKYVKNPIVKPIINQIIN